MAPILGSLRSLTEVTVTTWITQYPQYPQYPNNMLLSQNPAFKANYLAHVGGPGADFYVADDNVSAYITTRLVFPIFHGLV